MGGGGGWGDGGMGDAGGGWGDGGMGGGGGGMGGWGDGGMVEGKQCSQQENNSLKEVPRLD